MAYDFDVIGWEDWAGDIHEGAPTDISDVAGTLTHFHDDSTGDEQWSWTYIEDPFDEWAEWYDLIAGIAESEYGMEIG